MFGKAYKQISIFDTRPRQLITVYSNQNSFCKVHLNHKLPRSRNPEHTLFTTRAENVEYGFCKTGKI